MDIKLTGALGKRTKYQQKEVAQLLINVTTHDGRDNDVTENGSHLPTVSIVGYCIVSNGLVIICIVWG